MEDLLTFILRSIVSDPDSVSVTPGERRGEPALLVSVAEEDRGAVIGRGGRTIQAIGAVLDAAAAPDRAPAIEVEAVRV